MVPSKQNWQVTVWVNDEPLVVGGHGLYSLRREVVQQLMNRGSKGLTEFSNRRAAPNDAEDDAQDDAEDRTFPPRNRYLLLDAHSVQDARVQAAYTRAGYYLPDETQEVEPGWYLFAPHRYRMPSEMPPRFDTLRLAALDLAENVLLPEMGPDYVNPFAGLESIPLHHIKTIMRVKGQERANDALDRGWHLLTLDTEGTEDRMGDIKDRETVFVLGHTESHAR
jgi:hypothetical protein